MNARTRLHTRACTTTAHLDRQFLNAIRVKPDCLPSVPAAVVARLKKDGLL
ncbi:hypothetical protein [Paenochrobactrum pullorum]|uniref:hypothetical protein n=1 Tax=Paenochrobactrum pullorum TaxID=1324351 RepID=UPI0035BBD7E9